MESKAVFWGGAQFLANRDFDLLCLLSALEAWRHVAEKDNLTSSDLAEVGLPSYHPPTLFNRNTTVCLDETLLSSWK